MVDRSTVGRAVKSVTAPETGREKLFDLSSSGRPVATVSLEMLQRADAASFVGIDAPQPDKWRSVFRSAKEVLPNGHTASVFGRFLTLAY